MKKITAVKFAVLEAVYWSIMASFGAYIASFNLSRGYSQSLVSIMIAVYMVSGFAGQFFWGSVCDRLQTNKKVFVGSVLTAGALQLAMYFIDNQLAFGLLYGLFGFMIGPLGSILDTWMLRSLDSDIRVYGVSRSCGSAGYAIVILISGNLINRFGYFVMPLISTGFLFMTVLMTFTLKDADLRQKSGSSVSLKDIMSIMKNPAYVTIIAIVFFIGLANAPVGNLKIMILQAVGGNVSTQGLDAFLGCMVQFLFFLLAGVFIAIPARIRLFIASLSMALAMLINFLAGNVSMIIVASLFMNVSYSFMIASSRELVMRCVEPKYQTTANGVSDAFYSFLAGTIALLYAGSVAQSFGIHTMILISLILSLIPPAIMLLFRRRLV